MAAVVFLGFVLGLDSFRVSAGLGGLRLTPSRRRLIAISFAVCDGIAPLVGILVGRSMLEAVGRWASVLGPLVLAGYGAYVIYLAWRCERSLVANNEIWIIFGIPLALSLDNLVAGVGIGMFQFPVLLSAFIIGSISGLMSLLGMWLGEMALKRLPVNAELLSGLVLICMAAMLALD